MPMVALGPSSQDVTEYVIRVPKNTTKNFNIMAFNAADKVNLATWNQAQLERDLSNKKIYQEKEMPKSGAGRGFRCKIREEALREKYGIVLKESQPKDQPWLLQVEGQLGWKFKGIKRGGVIEHTSYYIFTQCPDGAFEAFQVHNWYNFMPPSKGCTLTAWEEWERRNPVPNHLSIKQQWWWKDQEEDDKEKEKPGCKKAAELCICDLEDDLEMSSNDSKASGEEGGWGPKVKKKVPSSKGGQKKKKKGSDDEAFEVRDNGDFKGQEVDYMSASRSNSQEELEGKPKVTQQGESPKGMDKQSMSCDERQEDKKAPMLQEKKQRKHSCEESDINRETSLVRFMVKKTPPKREQKRLGGNSWLGTPSTEAGSTSSTLQAAASKLEQGKQTFEMPVAKQLQLDTGPQSLSGKSTPQQ